MGEIIGISLACRMPEDRTESIDNQRRTASDLAITKPRSAMVDRLTEVPIGTGKMMLSRHLEFDKEYLNLPIHRAGNGRIMSFLFDGKTVQQFKIRLAEAKPDFWVFADVGEYRGQTLTIEAEDHDLSAGALELITQSEEPARFEDLYRERYRPQFHFLARRGWINDPDGPVYHKGVYHLFY